MEPVVVTQAVAADAGPVAELIAALESSLYGRSAFSQADLVDEWSDVETPPATKLTQAGRRAQRRDMVKTPALRSITDWLPTPGH